MGKSSKQKDKLKKVKKDKKKKKSSSSSSSQEEIAEDPEDRKNTLAVASTFGLTLGSTLFDQLSLNLVSCLVYCPDPEDIAKQVFTNGPFPFKSCCSHSGRPKVFNLGRPARVSPT